MKKPEILTTARSMDELKRVLAAGADAVIIGESRWGMRLPGDFLISDIGDAMQIAREFQAKIYVSVNKIMDNEDVRELPDYLDALIRTGADSIIFGDPALLGAYRKLSSKLALHWNAEMTSTNYAAANYWAARGASRVVLARELNMEQVIDFKKNAKLEVQVQVHGATNIYHSRRNLIHSYLDHREGSRSQSDFGQDQGLYLVEAERLELSHPVFEDKNGTHIMSADDICMLDCLPELIDGGVDSIKLEGLIKSIEYNETVVRAYRSAVDAYTASPERYKMDPEWLLSIERLQDPKRELTYGFFYKEQVY
jgi:U32 family peptidase